MFANNIQGEEVAVVRVFWLGKSAAAVASRFGSTRLLLNQPLLLLLR